MDDGSDWVAEVRRWVQSGGHVQNPVPPADPNVDVDGTESGHDATRPVPGMPPGA